MAGRLHIAEMNIAALLTPTGLPSPTIRQPLLTSPNHSPRHPTSIIALTEEGAPELRSAFWGLTPPWLKQLDRAPHCARLEVLDSRPMYRDARHHRCLVPVTGVYIWMTQASGKQPFMVTHVDRRPLLLAGIRTFYPDPLQKTMPPHSSSSPRGRESFALITLESNALIAPFSDRLPAILEAESVSTWLSATTTPEEACALLSPAPLDALGIFPVSRAINAPSCQEWHLSHPIGPMRTAPRNDDADAQQ
ncbi:SOS response-associated peptidase [Zymobacter sp. IVIA_12111.31 C1]|uniref:SOS response-associated peptidase n=1 Tax=Zymobacter sp. IVIA_12111.31 C1 TaxID=3394854 RepID=UPI0039C480E5